MNYKWLSTLVAALALASVCTFARADHHIGGHNLKVLRHSKAIIGDNVKPLPMITMIYQPECPWCKRQSETLAKIAHQCAEHVTINLVGNNGNKRNLKRELKHYPQILPAYLANTNFLRSVGGIKASPTTLFYDEHGQLLSKQRGFITPEKLAIAASLLTDKKCSA